MFRRPTLLEGGPVAEFLAVTRWQIGSSPTQARPPRPIVGRRRRPPSQQSGRASIHPDTDPRFGACLQDWS